MDELAFALHAVQRGYVDLGKIQECQQMCQAVRAQGLQMSLHEALLGKGYLSVDQVMEIMMACSANAATKKEQLPVRPFQLPSPNRPPRKKTQREILNPLTRQSELRARRNIALAATAAVLFVSLILIVVFSAGSTPLTVSKGAADLPSYTWLRNRVITLLQSEDFDGACRVLEQNMNALGPGESFTLRKEIEDHADRVLSSLPDIKLEKLSPDEASRLDERLSRLRSHSTGISRLAVAVDSRRAEIKNFQQALLLYAALEQKLAALVAKGDFKSALELSRTELVQSTNAHLSSRIERKIDELRTILAASSEVSPMTPVEELIRQAKAAMAKNDWTTSAWLLQSADERSPNNPEILGPLSWVLIEKGENANAIAVAQKAITIRPDQTDATATLGVGAHLDSRFEEAIKHYNSALAARPTFAAVLIRRSECFLKQGRYNDALRDAREYARHDSRRELVLKGYRVRATALVRLKLFPEALDELQAWLSQEPWDKEALLLQGEALHELGRVDEARRSLQSALITDPSDSAVRERLAAMEKLPSISDKTSDIEIANARILLGEKRKVGETLRFLYQVSNRGQSTLEGQVVHALERLGPEPQVSVLKQKRVLARQYLMEEEELPLSIGESRNWECQINTTGFPPGRYVVSLQYQVKAQPYGVRSVPFELEIENSKAKSPGEKDKNPSNQPTVLRALDKIAGRITQLQGDLSILTLVDRSPSMAEDIKIVSQRLQESLGELLDQRKPSLAIGTFDSDWNVIGKWNQDLDMIMSKLATIETDGTGNEMLMCAVRGACSFLSGRPGNRILILLTDEVGSDPETLEETLVAAKTAQVRIFIIGPEAPFHWHQSYEPGQNYHVATDTGPETARFETLQLSPIGNSSRGFYLYRKTSNPLRVHATENPLRCDLGSDAQVKSGFGPYALVRLARETQGAFLFLRPTSYEEGLLSGFEPDWCSLQEYDRRAKSDRIRSAVMNAVGAWPLPERKGFEILAVPGSVGITVEVGKQEAAIAEARALIKRCDEQMSELRPLTAARNEKGASKRWRANADLVKAQVAAARYYLIQYILAVNEWKPAGPRITYGTLEYGPRRKSSEADAAYEVARKCFTDVVDRYAGTPWSETAQRNLKQLGGFSIRDNDPDVKYGDWKAPPEETPK